MIDSVILWEPWTNESIHVQMHINIKINGTSSRLWCYRRVSATVKK